VTSASQLSVISACDR